MNDDGTYQHELVSPVFPSLATALGDGAVAQPDVFQVGGTTVAFIGITDAFASPAGSGACGVMCAGIYLLDNGALTAAAPAPGAMAGSAAFESQPRLAGTGAIVDSYTQYSAVSGTTLGTPSVQGIYTQPIPPTGALTIGAPWADTVTETLPAEADAAPDPVNPGVLAWVVNEDPTCALYAVAGSPMCQYEIRVGTTSTIPAPVSIYDDESPGGRGPTSLAWSSNGADLLIVDDQPPNDGIYEFSATTASAPAAKTVTEVIAEPPGWTFGQARFAGSKIVFDAAGAGKSTPATSDIYSISANCNAGTCAFPANATNLTHDPSADNVEPAWTSATAPLVGAGDALTSTTTPAIDAASVVAGKITPTTGVGIEVTLNEAGTLAVHIDHDGNLLGSVSVKAPAGAYAFVVKRLHGRTLAPAHDTATLSVAGGSSSASQPRLSFTVAR
jgi:hypothetical protein